jgi:phenylalanyl-tRNA synthetase beta chain
MGGLNSEIVDDTDTILVEAANFNADSVRLTSKKLGVRSEASSRFEKGVSADLSGAAADRVCALVVETGAGSALPGAVDRYPGRQSVAPIEVRAARMNALLGTTLSADAMQSILRRLGMETERRPDGPSGAEIFTVAPPHVRVDVKEEIDISEEIARIYGYDALGVTLHKDNARASVSAKWRLRGLVRDVLTGLGYNEIQTYSFVSPKGLDRIAVPEDSKRRALVRLINPLGEENSVMRTMLLPNLLDILSGNDHRGNDDVALFEIGNTFTDGGGELPEERVMLALGFYGSGPYAGAGKDDARNGFFALKGALSLLFQRLGVKDEAWTATSDTGTWHPGRCARVEAPEGVSLGYAGELHPDVARSYDIGAPVYAAEIDLETLIGMADGTRAYAPLRRYPAVTLDISVLADASVTVAEIERIATREGGALLESVRLFDVYRGSQIPAGKKSLAFNLVYRVGDRTLTDEEVGPVHARALKAIEKETGATLRDV